MAECKDKVLEESSKQSEGSTEAFDYPPNITDPVDRKIIEHYLKGWPIKKIVEHVTVTHTRCMQRLLKPEVKEFIDKIQNARIHFITLKVASELEELLEMELELCKTGKRDDQVKLKAVQARIERLTMRGTQKIGNGPFKDDDAVLAVLEASKKDSEE